MNAIEQNTERLLSDLKRVVRDSEDLLQTTGDVVGDKAREVRERLSEAIRAANRTCRGLENKTIQSARTVDTLIRKHPYESLGLALGIGCLLWIVSSRK